MADDLDSLVKGAPLSGPGSLGYKAAATSLGLGGSGSGSPDGDPLSHTPGSPAMIYLNLLILEASLRAQYLALRARRRHHTFFLILLSGWILGFGYALFLAPREDGSGVGGSVYWVVDVIEKVCFMGGVITAVLIWATGIWDRGVRWPRRWFNVSNRGLRHINCKLVLMKRSWLAETLSTLAWFLTYGLLSNGAGVSSYRYVEPAILREVDRELHLSATGHPSVSPSPGRTAVGINTMPAIVTRDEEKGGSRAAATQHTTHGHGHGHSHSHSHPGMQHLHAHQEDLAPGGDYVKLLLLAKPFSPTFRENWELYRQEYWERENERRALIRRKLKEQDRALRYSSGSWFWWLPGRSAITASEQPRPFTPRGRGGDVSASASASASGGSGDKNAHHQLHHPRHAAVEREHRRTRSNSSRRGSMSTGSRSGTSVEVEDAAAAAAVGRKESTGSNTSDRRRKKSSVSTSQAMTRTVSGAARRPNATDSRSVTPEIPSPLARENSMSAAG